MRSSACVLLLLIICAHHFMTIEPAEARAEGVKCLGSQRPEELSAHDLSVVLPCFLQNVGATISHAVLRCVCVCGYEAVFALTLEVVKKLSAPTPHTYMQTCMHAVGRDPQKCVFAGRVDV